MELSPGFINGVHPGVIPYTEKTWNAFKERLANTLDRDALDCSFLSSDEGLKNYIINYAEKELKSEQKDKERIQSRTNIRLSIVEIQTSRGVKQYPVINEHHGHHLMRTRYFRRNGNTVEMGVVEVLEEKPTLIITT